MTTSHEKLKPTVLLPIVLLLLLTALAIASVLHLPSDSFNGAQLLYRYAEQFRVGNGLVFNAGERVLLVPSPLYMLLLGLASAVFPAMDISGIAAVIFALSLGIGSLAIYGIARQAGLTVLLATGTALLYLLIWPLWSAAGTAYPVAATFCLLAIAFALDERWQLSGVFLASAILCAPESLLLGIPLLLFGSSKGKGIQFIIALVLPLIIAFSVLRAYYGALLWDGLLLPTTSTEIDWFFILPLPVLGLVIWALNRNTSNPIVNICAAWIILYLLMIVGLLRIQTESNYSVISGPGLLLVVIGIRLAQTSSAQGNEKPVSLSRRIIRILSFTSLVAVLIASLLFSSQIIDIFAPPFSPSAQIRTIGLRWPPLNVDVSPQQSIISFDGQLQPELKAMIERGDMQSALIRYAPDVIVIGNGRLRTRDLNSPAVARLGYRPDERSDNYIRGVAIGDFATTPIAANFGPDIKLTGTALDQSSLKPGKLLRVRLDWQFVRPASKDVTVDLRLITGQGDQYVLAHANDTYAPSIFRAGPYSTYHTLTVVESAWSGPVILQVAIEINGGVAARVPIAKFNITTP